MEFLKRVFNAILMTLESIIATITILTLLILFIKVSGIWSLLLLPFLIGLVAGFIGDE